MSEDLFGAGRLDDVMSLVAAEGAAGFRADFFLSREDNMAAGYLIAQGKLEICGGGDNEPYLVRVKGARSANLDSVRGSASKAKELESVAARVVKETANFAPRMFKGTEPEPPPPTPPAEIKETKPEGMSPLDHAREALQYIATFAKSLEAAQEAAGAGLRKMAGVDTE